MTPRNSWRRVRWAGISTSVLRAAVTLAAMAALGGCGGRTAAPYEQGDERYRFTFRLERVRGEVGACTGIMSVRDLRADRTLKIPMHTVPWGVKTQAAATDEAYGARFEVTTTVNAPGTVGEVRGVLRRGATLVASRTAKVRVTVTENPPEIRIR